MSELPFIDLHPEKIPGPGPEPALAACRGFLDMALRNGWKEVRIITGIGIHGDGTPRLRSRVEKEVLSAYYSSIESQHYEQGGAVIRLRLSPPAQHPGPAQRRKLQKEAEHRRSMQKEERLMVLLERFEAAEAYFDESDLRRVRLKLNQILREFFPGETAVAADESSLQQAMQRIKKKIDALH
ncbi:MAG: Smr/MutS family protein [candidate division FCPU426 bacterium]